MDAAEGQRGSRRLGRYIRQLREGYGYTLRRVEEQSQRYGSPIDNSQLSRFEKGKAAPSFDKLRILARVFNVPVQTFSDVLDLQEYDGLKPGGQDPEVLFQAGLDAYRKGEYGASYAAFERLEELSGAENGTVAAENNARAHYHMAVALKKMGRLAMAESELRRLMRRPEGSYPLSLRVRVLLQLSFIYRELGDLYLASVIARECHMRAVDNSDEQTIAAALNSAGIIEEEQGHHEQAAAHFKAALDVLRENEDLELMRITAQANLGGALAASGKFRAGVALLRQSLSRARKNGFQRALAQSLTKLGSCYLSKGHIKMSREFLRESDAIAEGGGDHYNDILFINAYLNWQMAREANRTTQERILFGRLKYLRSTLESRFAEVDAFDAMVRGERQYG